MAFGLGFVGASLLILAALTSAERAEAAGGGIVTHELDGGKLSWAEIRRARPLEPPVIRAGDATIVPPRQSGGAGGAARVRKPRYVRGSVPLGMPTTEIVAPPVIAGGFHSNPVENHTAYPNSTNGRLVGRSKGVGEFTCSATVVHARNRSVVFTAGHCVKDRYFSWARDIAFLPAVGYGARPYGRWQAESVKVPRAWARKGNHAYDYAAVVLKPRRGRRIEEVTGAVGFAYDLRPQDQRFRAVGYPLNRGGARKMWECNDEFGGLRPYPRRGRKPIGIGCDMTGGASGGGWTVAGRRWLQLNSVSSFNDTRLENAIFGPQFTELAERIRRTAGAR